MRKKLVDIFYTFRIRFLLRLLYCAFGCKFKIKQGNSFAFSRSVFLKCLFNIKGKNNEINIKDGAFLENCNINIRGNNNKITIEDNAYANELNIVIENDNNELYIGKNFFVCGKTRLYIVDGSRLTFGDGCMLSDNIEIRTTDNHAIYDIASGERINPEKDVAVGEHVWIGMGATILKGVTVADGCIIGARSIITKPVEEKNCCVTGINKITKKNVKWTMER